MEYKAIMAKSLQHSSANKIQIHPIEDVYIMKIYYDDIINSMVDDIGKAGYTMPKKMWDILPGGMPYVWFERG